MRTLVFKAVILFIISVCFFDLVIASNTVNIYNAESKQIGQGLQLSSTMVVTSNKIVGKEGIIFKKDSIAYTKYTVIFNDPISQLVFLQINMPFKTITLKPENKMIPMESVYAEIDGKLTDIGFFSAYVKGYGSYIGNYDNLYEAMPLYDKNGAVIGILFGRLADKLYLYLSVEWLYFYRDNMNTIVKAKKPVLNIVVHELWDQPGILIGKSKNDNFKAGDVIVRVNNTMIRNVLDFHRALIAYSAFDSMTVSVLRSGTLVAVDYSCRRDNK